ncbi:myophilin isoform X1 [Hydra vulgaris]|uniref:Calponin n=1 Tax=Hydra vulgaris TaxID=6087 RepID=T2M369_HYDVU|nr:myophilin [Hydra vulgaris]
MAERPAGYGLTAEVKNKISEKYCLELEKEALTWISSLVPDAQLENTSGMEATHKKLKDGVILCKLINALENDSVKKINDGKMVFKQMENISNFLEACSRYGLSKTDLFQTVDLFEAANMTQVIQTIHALGRKAKSKGAPGIGPKESNKNVREFTEDQLRAGQGVIGLQMGSNKGATQAGQNFGKTRAILD